MNIEIQNYSYSTYKENLAKKAIKKYAKKILGKENFKKVDKFKLVLMNNWGRKKNRFTDIPFSNLWDESTKTITIPIAPNWVREQRIDYGICHELVHTKDIMNGWLISEKPRGRDRLRIWWLHDDGYYYLYTKHIPEWIEDIMYSDSVAGQSYFELLSTCYPWEYEPLMARRVYMQ